MEKQGATTTVTKRDVIARQVSAVVFVALPSAALDSPALSAAASGFGFLGGLPRLRLTGGSSPSGLGYNKRKDASEARIGQKESDDVPWGVCPSFSSLRWRALPPRTRQRLCSSCSCCPWGDRDRV